MAYANGRIPADHLTALPREHWALAYPVRVTGPAAASFLRMAEAFRRDTGQVLTATDGYRSLDEQIAVFKNRYRPGRRPGGDNRSGGVLGGTWHRVTGAPVAPPGTSNHGLQDPQAMDLASGINSFGSRAHQWMRQNAAQYGWVHPHWARQGGPTPEPWHWEWHRNRDRLYGRPVESVRRLQQALRDAKHDIAVDGLPGPATTQHVIAFQGARGLTADGIVGPATEALLYRTTAPTTAQEDLTMAQIDDITAQLARLAAQQATILDKVLKTNEAVGRMERLHGAGVKNLATKDDVVTAEDAQ